MSCNEAGPCDRTYFSDLLAVGLTLCGWGLAVICLGIWAEQAVAQPAADTVVQLVVDYGDGVQKHFTELKWHEGVTVFDLMRAAARHPRGIRFKHLGQGATVLVTQIDGVQNEGASGSGHNWIYRVNGEIGDRSIGIRSVSPGDTILWRFENYR